MAIQYVKFKTKVAINGVSEEKYVARLKQETEIGFDKIADIPSCGICTPAQYYYKDL